MSLLGQGRVTPKSIFFSIVIQRGKKIGDTDLAQELEQLSGLNALGGSSPFPYEGCRKLVRSTGHHYEYLIPFLDLYFGDIAGYARSTKRFWRWDNDEMKQAQETIKLSFFERHPDYLELEVMITSDDTPDLYTYMVVHEQMRTLLLKLFGLFIERNTGLSQEQENT